MEKIVLVKEVRKKASSLGLPLNFVIGMISVNKSTFKAWDTGFFHPSKENVKRLEQVLITLKYLEDSKGEMRRI